MDLMIRANEKEKGGPIRVDMGPFKVNSGPLIINSDIL